MVCSDTRQSGGSLGPAWIALALLVCAAVLVPWAAILFLTLPRHYGASHWQLAWGGFDIGLGIALANTAIAALHRSPRGEVAAAVTGTLLICDAWFDVLTSHGSADVAKAVGEAAFVEGPPPTGTKSTSTSPSAARCSGRSPGWPKSPKWATRRPSSAKRKIVFGPCAEPAAKPRQINRRAASSSDWHRGKRTTSSSFLKSR